MNCTLLLFIETVVKNVYFYFPGIGPCDNELDPAWVGAVVLADHPTSLECDTAGFFHLILLNAAFVAITLIPKITKF